MLALAMLIFMFSLAGIPPLAGFWGKLYIFMAAVEARLFWPAVLGVLASVVASYYYLRIVKVMYFDEGTEALDPARSASTVPWPSCRGLLSRVLAGATAAQPDRRGRRQGPVPVISAPVLPDGWTLVALESVGSTNDEAARLAEAGAPEGTVVWAREQTGGRGRRGRVWASPVGNLYSSTILRPTARRRARPSWASWRRCRGRHRAGRPRRAVKWPNDVLVDGGKVAGILPESAIGAEAGPSTW
jgi:hypothetical protein